MAIFEHPEFDNHEHVAFYQDKASGLQAIIAVHNTRLGPSLGGCRMWAYEDSAAALTDVLRLSKGMTYKAAMANLPQGGGKAVIIGDPRKDKSEAKMQAMGKFVDTFNGQYVTAEDSGISVQDIDAMAQHTHYVSGNSAKYHFNAEPANGNPAPATAYGVFVGLKAAVSHALNTDLQGIRVGIQGVGQVGLLLGQHLQNAGAELVITDIYQGNLDKAAATLDAKVVRPDEISTAAVDVFAPCALGAIVNEHSLASMQAKVIAGAANNQLATEAMGTLCREAGILYAPDYVINGGGIIDIYHQSQSSSNEALRHHIETIGETLHTVFTRADESGLATNLVANLMAEERFQ